MPKIESAYTNRHRLKKKLRALEYLGGSCAVCGSDEELQFDHRDRKTKVLAIADAISNNWSWERLLVELDKCQLLCREHHLDKSRQEGSLCNPWNKWTEIHHGTLHGYEGYGCRCDPCREAKRVARKLRNHLVS